MLVSTSRLAIRIPLSRLLSTATTMANHYDALIIGSGQGGTPLAMAWAKAGKKTALVEGKHVGGTCVNEGCTPTKTMVASGRAAYMACGAKSMGIEFKRSSLQLNLETVRRRKREMVDSFRGGSEARINATENLDLIMGTASFKSSTEIDILVNDTQVVRTVTADKVFVNAGCAPTPLNIKDIHIIEPGNLLDSTSIMELSEVPRHLVVIGGGPIGLEFAQLFRRFGSEVSIVSRSAHLLPNEDTDISTEMEKILTEDGIKIYLSAQTQWFSKVPTGSVILSILTSKGETKSLFTSHVLNATGRSPNTSDLGLENAGIKTTSRGFIVVNENLETSAPGIYALGDVKGGPAFTHISYDDFRILKHNLLTKPNDRPLSTKNRFVPYCVFTDPQLGRVGMTEKQAVQLLKPSSANVTDSTEFASIGQDPDRTPTTENPNAYENPRVAAVSMPMSWVARALEANEKRGVMKAVIDKETDLIVGFACLGYEGGEVMSAVQMAMMGGLTWNQLRDGCFAHPCLSEAFNNLFAMFGED